MMLDIESQPNNNQAYTMSHYYLKSKNRETCQFMCFNHIFVLRKYSGGRMNTEVSTNKSKLTYYKVTQHENNIST